MKTPSPLIAQADARVWLRHFPCGNNSYRAAAEVSDEYCKLLDLLVASGVMTEEEREEWLQEARHPSVKKRDREHYEFWWHERDEEEWWEEEEEEEEEEGV